jgi:hypothetical protein
MFSNLLLPAFIWALIPSSAACCLYPQPVSSFNVGDKVLRPNETIIRVKISYIFVFVFLDRKPEEKYSEQTVAGISLH